MPRPAPVDPRPLLAGFAFVVVAGGAVAAALDSADVVTNEAELPVGWFAVGLAVIGACVLGIGAAFVRGALPDLPRLLAVAALALLPAVLAVVAFSVIGSAWLYLVGAAFTLTGLLRLSSAR